MFTCFFTWIKINLIRDSNLAVYMDAKSSDPIMPCVYMHQAFNQMKPF